MTQGTPEQFRRLVSEARWDNAIALLRWLHPPVAGEAFISLPLEGQKGLFRTLPIDLAAILVENLPYYDAYALLRVRPVHEIRAVLDSLNPFAWEQFFEDVSGKAWQQLVDGPPDEPPGADGAARRTTERPAMRGVLPGHAIIEAKRIEKVFHQPDGGVVQVLAPLDLSLAAGMIVAVLGPSGSGKSTLLRILSGLTPPTSGEVLWHGKPVGESPGRAAIVFQSFALFPWLTVVENVEVPLLARGASRAERRQRASKVLDSVGLTGFANAYPKELSGGMKQRVGLARALAVEPEVLFMDEPFSALDVLTAENLRGELMELWSKKEIPTKSIFLVTHNIEEAVLLADRVVVLGTHPARIRSDFRIPLPRPRERKSAEFLVYVDYIYKVMTQPERELGPLTKLPLMRKPSFQVLPHATAGGMAGLLEFLNDRGGKEDLYHLSEELLMEVDDLFPIMDAAVMLGFAHSKEGDVQITPEGKAFAEADIPQRKKLFQKAVLNHATLLRQIRNALERKSDGTLPLEFFRDVLDEHFSQEDVQSQIDTALNWGRYAEIFAYDSETD